MCVCVPERVGAFTQQKTVVRTEQSNFKPALRFYSTAAYGISAERADLNSVQLVISH